MAARRRPRTARRNPLQIAQRAYERAMARTAAACDADDGSPEAARRVDAALRLEARAYRQVQTALLHHHTR